MGGKRNIRGVRISKLKKVKIKKSKVKTLYKNEVKGKKLSRKHKKRVKRQIVKREKKKEVRYYRYSIAFFVHFRSDGDTIDKTFRSDIYTNHPLDNRMIEVKLIRFTNDKVSKLNMGLQAMYNRSQYLGLEGEEVGVNDVGHSQLNRMMFWID